MAFTVIPVENEWQANKMHNTHQRRKVIQEINPWCICILRVAPKTIGSECQIAIVKTHDFSDINKG